MSRSLRIAVADDEQDMREYFQAVLPRLGHQVVALAENGRQLADLCRSTPPDLVLTDIKMPDMNGFDLATAINDVRPTPVILVSAHHDAESLNRAASGPVLGYLVKPVKEADIKAAITIAMVRFQQFQAIAKEAADSRQALEDRKLIERAKGIVMKRIRVDEEEAFRRLRKIASDENRKLTEVAKTIISAETIFHQLDRL